MNDLDTNIQEHSSFLFLFFFKRAALPPYFNFSRENPPSNLDAITLTYGRGRAHANDLVRRYLARRPSKDPLQEWK